MNIHRLYIQNGNSAGFWIQHRTWQNRCAQVQSIAGRSRGALPATWATDAHTNVFVQCYDVRSGRPVPASMVVDLPEDCGYVLIAQPPWYVRPIGADARTAGQLVEFKFETPESEAEADPIQEGLR